MNFLAHIHIATHCKSDITGNLLGDFVKGNPVGRYPDDVVEGIRLHRFVDTFTDHHPISKKAKQLFHPDRRRFAMIALDVFWDHCLVNDWDNYSDKDLEQFCHFAELKTQNRDYELPERYTNIMHSVWKNRWFLSYRQLENIGYALQRMSARSERMAPLAECFVDIEHHYDTLRALFPELYTDVLKRSLEQVQKTPTHKP